MKDYEILLIEPLSMMRCFENETLLSAMRRQIHHTCIQGCYGGGCGRCRVQIIRGTYDICKKMSNVYIQNRGDENNIVLACCIKPTSDLEIRIISQE